ncbi:hypothetical protein EXU48_08815 [Occultella glacieicola]|uniref:Uncharacterized protein n=1 Tax=Occultella glacieicola TaxID=2518684 RepID=A0ABY2E4C5_9MICO|nr:hypothetical protein [Occultella glacieicola]TDE94880.1 hypothetical protein EXU48_08815 [Occultella glacieicola]
MSTSPTVRRPRRRAVLLGGLATVGAAAGSVFAGAPFALPAHGAPSSAGPLPPVAALPDGQPDRTSFEPAEQRFATFLVTLADIANDVDDTDTELRGFIHGGWWRSPAEPFNARISELVYVLAWFVTTERSWNPYVGDPALLARLDAALDHYLRLQHEDGSWPEYEPQERSRAATAFALGYLSKTLAHLRAADLLPQRRAALSTAMYAAMTWFLDPANTGIWQPERVEFVNQPMAGLAGAAKALTLDPDPALQALLRNRVDYLAAHGQSPAGFLYEPRGMDIAYNLNVTLTEVIEIHEALGHPVLLPLVRRLADWLGYANVPEPDGSGLISFASGAARTPMYFLDDATTDFQQRDLGSVLSGRVPALRPFYTTAGDRDRIRAEWAADPDPVPALTPGAVNPRIPANIGYGEDYPSRRAKDLALAQMPPVRRRRFTELRTDPQDQYYLFVRRPSHYVQAFFGTRPNGVVRAGFGLLWHPEGGVFVHGGQNSNTECWASVFAAGGTDGASNLAPTFYDGPVTHGHIVTDVSDVGDLGIGWTTTGGNVTGAALLTDDGLVREITTTMDAREQIPLVLMPTDDLRWSDGTRAEYGTATTAVATSATLTRGQVSLVIDWGSAVEVTLTPTERTYFADGRRRAHMLRVPHGRAGRIAYTFTG